MSASTPPNDSAYAAAIDLKKAGVGIAAIVDLRDNPTGAAVDEARALGIEINHGRAVITRRRQAAGLLDDHPAEGRRRRAHHSRRRAADVGRLDAVGASVLAVARQGRLRRRDEALPARRLRAGLRLGRRLQRHRRPGGDGRRGAGGRREGGEGCRRQGASGAPKLKAEAGESWAGGNARRGPGAGAGHDGQGLRRFPERRHRQGHPPGGA